MKSRCVLQFFYFLSSIVLSKAQDMVGPTLSCFTSIRGNVQTRISFLHEDTVGVRSLHLTIWSQDMRLVTCTVNANPQITERYHSLCKTSNTRGQEVSYGFNISSILLALQKADCAHLEASSASKLTRRTRTDETERKARRKRAWIFPGTLWCGSGSTADGYEELGETAEFWFSDFVVKTYFGLFEVFEDFGDKRRPVSRSSLVFVISSSAY